MFAFEDLEAVAIRNAAGALLADADIAEEGFQLDPANLEFDGNSALLRIEVSSGELTNQYRVTIFRAMPEESGVFAVLVDDVPVFADSRTGRFVHRIDFRRRRVRIQPLPSNPAATHRIGVRGSRQINLVEREVDLAVGINTLVVRVTSPNGESQAEFELILERLASERETLGRIFAATGGPSWVENTGWLSDDPLSDWYGVTTDSGGRVVELDLWSNGLSGSVPESLGDLAVLRSLDLRQNQLTGQIPTRLGRLGELVVLDLSENHLVGPLPSEILRLPELLLLQLDGNNLSGTLPDEFTPGQRLVGLGLSENDFSGPVPQSLGRLRFLGTLRLFGNNLAGCLPTALHNEVLIFHDFNRLDLPFCDSGLRELQVSAGTLQPGFSPGHGRYRLVLGPDESADLLTIAPKPFVAGSEVRFVGLDSELPADSEPVTAGLQLDVSQLNLMDAPFRLEVRMAGLGGGRSYGIQIERAQPDDARIESISVGGFASALPDGSYYLRRWVDFNSDRVNIQVQPHSPVATLEYFYPPHGNLGLRPLLDADDDDGNGFQIDLAVGPNIYLLRVNALDLSAQIYALVLVRVPGEPDGPTIGFAHRFDDSLELDWNPPQDDGGSHITGYDIRYVYAAAPVKTDPYWTVLSGIAGDLELSRSITGIEENLKYEVQVRARNRVGAGPWSAAVAA